MTATIDHQDVALVELLRSPEYRDWRTQVEGIRGCAVPVQLSGSSTIRDRDGVIVHERARQILAPCGNEQ